MAQPKPALYAASVTGLAFVCLALAAAAVGIPIWGYFENVNGGGSWESERGYFGPWKTCKRLNYGRELCGDVRFRPSGKWNTSLRSTVNFFCMQQCNFHSSSLVGVYISGILAAVSCSLLGIFCILSIIQIAMISSRDKVVMKYKPLVIIKLILSLASGIITMNTIEINLYFYI